MEIEPTKTRDVGIAVISKAARLLDVLTEAGEASSAVLAERTGEPLSSVYRLLSSLDDIGWVEAGSRRGTYRLGMTFISLAGRAESRLDVRHAAAPVLQRLHATTGETAFLCIRRGDRAVCIERIDGARVQSLALRLGESLPLHVGAAPRALLAFEPPAAWHSYVARLAVDPDVEYGLSSETEVVQDLERIRDIGYVVSDGDVTPGIAAIGAPVFNHRGHVVAAISLSGLTSSILGRGARSSGSNVRALVTDGAAEVSTYLGHAGLRRPRLTLA